METTGRLTFGLAAVIALVGTRFVSAACVLTELLSPSSVTSVALDGDVIVTAAPFAFGVSSFTGAAFVYRYQRGAWEFEAKLHASDGEYDDRFGWSVAISNDVVVVGSRDDEHDGFDVGSAYVYRFDGSGWVNEAKLIPPDGEFLDRFGRSVAISDGVLLVGAYLDDDAGDRSGSVYVYRFNGFDWRLETKLVASDGAEGDEFGYSVAVEGDAAVIGARHFFNGGAGTAYVFRFNGTIWCEEAKLEALDGEENDFFGGDVDISENTVIVGALGSDDFGSFTGSAHVFSFDGTTWRKEQKLLAAVPAHTDYFGETVSVSGDFAIVGAHGDDPTGSVTVFQSVDGTWIWTERIEASDGSVSDQFGADSIAIQEDVAVVSANNHHHGAYTGPAFVFAGFKSIDCDENGIPDACQIAEGFSQDCNSNFVPDACDISDGTSEDIGANGIPDECEAVVVDLDIEPGECPNEFEPRLGNSGHKIDIALLGTEEFDVTEVDFSTILLSRADGVGGAVLPERVRVKDRATPFDGEPCGCHERKKDGIPDLRMRFFAVEMTFEMELDLLAEGESLELMVTGELLDGTPFVASDCIVIDDPPGRDDDDSDDDSDSDSDDDSDDDSDS